MIRAYQAQAIVLKKAKMGEADVRLTLLTKERGKIIVMAKGLRKITSRKAPYLDLFSHININLYQGKSFDIVTDVTPINNFKNLKTKLRNIALTFKIAEVLERILPLDEPCGQVFESLLESLEFLEKAPEEEVMSIWHDFANQLLWQLGYLTEGKILKNRELDNYLESVLEKSIKSSELLTNVERQIK